MLLFLTPSFVLGIKSALIATTYKAPQDPSLAYPLSWSFDGLSLIHSAWLHCPNISRLLPPDRSDLFLPSRLCTSCFLCLQCSAPELTLGGGRPLGDGYAGFRCHLLQEVFPSPPVQWSSCSTQRCFIFSTTSSHLEPSLCLCLLFPCQDLSSMGGSSLSVLSTLYS